jgi:predicted kinase
VQVRRPIDIGQVGQVRVLRGIGAMVMCAPVLSLDPVEAAIWRCGITPSFETGIAAYEVAAVLAEHQLSLGLTAIVDSVSSVEVARDMWRHAVSRAGAQLRSSKWNRGRTIDW